MRDSTPPTTPASYSIYRQHDQFWHLITHQHNLLMDPCKHAFLCHWFFKDKGFVLALFYNPYSPQHVASHIAAAEKRSVESNAIRGLGTWADSLAKWMNLVFLCFHPSSKAWFPEHLISQILAWEQSKAGVGKLSVKSQTVNISGFAGHTVSVAIFQLCRCSAQSSNRQYLKEWTWLCSKKNFI